MLVLFLSGLLAAALNSQKQWQIILMNGKNEINPYYIWV